MLVLSISLSDGAILGTPDFPWWFSVQLGHLHMKKGNGHTHSSVEGGGGGEVCVILGNALLVEFSEMI